MPAKSNKAIKKISPKNRIDDDLRFLIAARAAAKNESDLQNLAKMLGPAFKARIRQQQRFEGDDIAYYRIEAVRILKKAYDSHRGPDKVPDDILKKIVRNFLAIPLTIPNLSDVLAVLRRKKSDLYRDTAGLSQRDADKAENFNTAISRATTKELAAINIEAAFGLFPKHRLAKRSVGAKNLSKLERSDPIQRIREYLDSDIRYDAIEYVLKSVFRFSDDAVDAATTVLWRSLLDEDLT